MLIEIERNLRPNEEQMKKLLEGAEKVKEGTDTDVYYDFADYRLHGDKIHLRARNGVYEMKMHFKGQKDQLVSIQQEYDIMNRNDAEVIQHTLKLSGNAPVEALIDECIKNGMLQPFSTITSHKVRYKKDGVTIVVNKTDTNYELTELECLRFSEIEIDEAEAKIKHLAVDAGMGKEFEGEKVMGKFKENLSIKNPELYKKLYILTEHKEIKKTRFEQLWGKFK